MKELFPGNCSWCIDVMNDVLISQTKDMPTAESDAKSKPFLILMSQILLYALYGECKIGDYDGSLLEPLYSAIEIVDEYRRCRDPKKRICATNELLLDGDLKSHLWCMTMASIFPGVNCRPKSPV